MFYILTAITLLIAIVFGIAMSIYVDKHCDD